MALTILLTAGVSSASAERGPDPNGPAKFGLCKAYFAGNSPKPKQGVAFKRLISAAGGTDNVATYCQGATPGKSGKHPANKGEQDEDERD
jgi:hypothetical protein